MKRNRQLFLAALLVTLFGAALTGYYRITIQGTTGSSIVNDTFFTGQDCFPTGPASALDLRIVSDSTGMPVNGDTIDAVDIDGCVFSVNHTETQVVHIVQFAAGQGGWSTPIFPPGAVVGGTLNVTVSYQGATYHFVVDNPFPPSGSECVTLRVPSGNVTNVAEELPGQGCPS